MKKIFVSQPTFHGNEKKYVNECLDTTWISSKGRFIDLFEDKFAEYLGVKHAIATSSGTTALHLSLLALGIQQGDEVIVPTLTYIATANAVKYCDATPVFVDSEPNTWNINPHLIESKITSRTKAIIVVHLYGHPADMDPIIEIAKKYKLFVIEDAAEAHGALYKRDLTGSIGDIGVFSFFGNKIITTGEGGMLVTNNDKLAEKVRILKGQGMDPDKRYWFPIVGYNYRMTNIQAAIGLAQLENMSWHLSQRIRVANLYKKYLQNESSLKIQTEEKWANHSYWMVTILLSSELGDKRDEIMKILKETVETRPIFYPLHLMPPYFEENTHYSVAEDIARRGINLPSHAQLEEEDIKFITDQVISALKSIR